MYPIERLSWLEKLTKTPRGPYFYYVLATIYSLPEIVFRLIYTAAHNLVGDIPILRQIVLLPLLLVGRVIMAITSPYRTVIERLIEYDSRKPEDTILSMKWPLIVLTTALVLAIVLLSIPTGLGPLAGVAAFLTTKLPLVAPLLSALTAAMATVMPLVAAQVLAALVTFAVGVTVLRNIANYLDNIISQKTFIHAFKAIFTGLSLLVYTNEKAIFTELSSLDCTNESVYTIELPSQEGTETVNYPHSDTDAEMGIRGFPTLTKDLDYLTGKIKEAWKDWRTSGTQRYEAYEAHTSGKSGLQHASSADFADANGVAQHSKNQHEVNADADGERMGMVEDNTDQPGPGRR